MLISHAHNAQMRATSSYGTSGAWSEPEQLVILGVSQPENSTAAVQGVDHNRVGTVNVVSVNVTATWSQAFEGGDADSTDIDASGDGLGPLGMTNSTDDNSMLPTPGRSRRNTDNIGSGSGFDPSSSMTVRQPDEDIVGYELVIGVSPVAEEFGNVPEASQTHYSQIIKNVSPSTLTCMYMYLV